MCDVRVIVEREGCDDASADVPGEGAAEDLVQFICIPLGLADAAMWSLTIDETACEDGDWVTLDDKQRVGLRLKQRYVARELVKENDGIDPVTPEALSTAIRSRNWRLMRLLLDCELLEERKAEEILTLGLLDLAAAPQRPALNRPGPPGMILGEGEDKAVQHVSVLVAAGANVNGCREAGPRRRKPPLMLSMEQGRVDVALELLRCGADVALRDTFGKTPLMYASLLGDLEVLKQVLQHGCHLPGFIDAKNFQGKTALMQAAQAGHVEVCEALLDAGACIGLGNDYDETALVAAAAMGHQKVCFLLLQRGADVASKDAEWRNALMQAAQAGYHLVSRTLIHAGADVNARDMLGRTAVILTAFENRVEALQELIAASALVDAADDNHNKTALMYAAQEGSSECCTLLVRAGAGVNAVDASGISCLMYASECPTQEISKALLDAGAQTDLQDSNGTTALMYASAVDNTGTVRLLLSAGAAVNAKDNHGRTALTYAAAEGHVATTLQLLEHHADVETRDVEGVTPLMYAMGAAPHPGGMIGSRVPPVCEVLVRAGARLDKNAAHQFGRYNDLVDICYSAVREPSAAIAAMMHHEEVHRNFINNSHAAGRNPSRPAAHPPPPCPRPPQRPPSANARPAARPQRRQEGEKRCCIM
eukprot:TRINITY_DN17595_c0_g2_i1.p1 TRINITY_DN17595_c0_g2~~TRINITY_DN17595_c0_g2_i1.p1  ORF type:complete len:651 (+),score=169.57 TRINITY_DN17595_c0_g2_i1:73-2025(+)